MEAQTSEKAHLVEGKSAVSPSSDLVPKAPTPRQVLMKLFYHTIAMFSLPFIAFFYSKRIIEESYGIGEPNNYIYAAITAVVVVQVIIFSYVYQAFQEEAIDRKIRAHEKNK